MALVKFAVTMASGGTLTSALDLGQTPTWKKIYVDPTGANSEVRFQASHALDGTYRQVYMPQVSSSSVQSNIWKIASAVSGGLQEAPSGLRFLKVETTAAVANGATFYLICSD